MKFMFFSNEIHLFYFNDSVLYKAVDRQSVKTVKVLLSNERIDVNMINIFNNLYFNKIIKSYFKISFYIIIFISFHIICSNYILNSNISIKFKINHFNSVSKYLNDISTAIFKLHSLLNISNKISKHSF